MILMKIQFYFLSFCLNIKCEVLFNLREPRVNNNDKKFMVLCRCNSCLGQMKLEEYRYAIGITFHVNILFGKKKANRDSNL